MLSAQLAPHSDAGDSNSALPPVTSTIQKASYQKSNLKTIVPNVLRL